MSRDKTMPAEEIADKIRNWRKQMVENNNENFAGRCVNDYNLLVEMIAGMRKDIDILMSCCELLAQCLAKQETIHSKEK